MFEFRRDLAVVPLQPEGVLEVYASVNQPQIAAENVDAQEASAYVVTGQGPGGILAFIYLWMHSSNQALVYAWDAPVMRDDYSEVRDAGMQFTESMGFMMEDLMLRRHDATERKGLLSALPIFAPLSQIDVVEEVEPDEPTDEGVLVLGESGPFPDESILILPVDMPTQIDSPEQHEAAGDPLEDKNLKVFLRLLASA